MPVGHMIRQLPDVIDAQSAGIELPVQRACRVEAPHFYGPFDGGTLPAESWLPVSQCHRYDLEVDLRRPRPVQPDLLFAVIATLFEVREIEEIELQEICVSTNSTSSTG